ncbi:uncharacterized protein LOC127750197 [Frankliniella occidentalis]|uniref:Uncharacterized protein LOC127750197 n=1 Tax=Frankliniella occidentalis TaxID=133901 RepID=A0A9C6UF29_FRAOC|nr:uncharacterized protein LOC127750197 [Frankliniella occidentalis]
MSAVAAVAEQDGLGLGPAARGAPGRHPALHPALHASSTVSSSSMPSSGMHDASWRRANLSWVPEQRPVGMSPAKQAYPGRAVAWSHTAYQSFDGQGQQGLVQGLGSSWYSTATNAPPSATASSQQVGFRPYRQMSEAGSQVGQWVEAGAGYDDPMLYPGHGLGGDPYYQQHYPVHGQGLERGHGRYGHLGQGHVQATAGLGHSPRLPDQHLANSMVQLDKSGNTRTELA